MKIKKMKYYLSLLLGIILFQFSYSQTTTYIHCGTLLDMTSLESKTEMTIIVTDDKISSVEKGYKKAIKGIETVDLKSYTVMPGLMDMHVHIEHESSPKRYEEKFRHNDADIAFRAAKYAQKTLKAGFTTVRDLGGSGVNVSLRNAINLGYVEGPRIFTAEKSLATTGGHADPTNGVRNDLKGNPGPKEGVINSVEDAYKAVRQRYKNGADCIKITATGGVLSVAKDGSGPQFTIEEVRAVVKAANDYGMTTAAHAHGVEGMRRAIEGGITSIEHGTMMNDELMELMKKHGTYYVPTISAGKFVAEKAAIPGFYPAVIVPKALAIGPMIQETFAKAYKKGVKIAYGTDTGVSYHGDNGKEFFYMVEAGMPAIEAIHSATVSAADLLNISDKLGTIEKGKYADIVAVKGDPLQDIKLMESIDFVMKSGVVYLK